MKRFTQQKKVLAESIPLLPTLFNVHDLYNMPAVQKKKIGIATVYRYLQTLSKNGDIHQYRCNNMYLYSKSVRQHTHFNCEKCGLVCHIDDYTIEIPQLVRGGRVCHVQIELTGICGACCNQ